LRTITQSFGTADDALALDLGADHEAGHVGQVEQRDPEGVAEPDEARGLVGAVGEEHAALVLGLRGDDAHRPPVDAGEGGDHLGREQLLQLEEAVGVDQLADEGEHVEELVLVGRDDLLDALPGRQRSARGDERKRRREVLRKVGQVLAGGVDRLLLRRH
jgi:hypothetical protein